jgi:hypothetical protein
MLLNGTQRSLTFPFQQLPVDNLGLYSQPSQTRLRNPVCFGVDIPSRMAVC